MCADSVEQQPKQNVEVASSAASKVNGTPRRGLTWLPPDEAAKHMRISCDFLLSLAKRGKIPCRRLSPRIFRFILEELNGDNSVTTGTAMACVSQEVGVPWLLAHEAAEHLRVKQRWLMEEGVKKWGIPHKKLGGRYRFVLAVLDACGKRALQASKRTRKKNKRELNSTAAPATPKQNSGTGESLSKWYMKKGFAGG